jgi:hypothetical protein
MTKVDEDIVRHTSLRPLSIRGEKFFVISVEDFKALILTTQYKDTVFSAPDFIKT